MLRCLRGRVWIGRRSCDGSCENKLLPLCHNHAKHSSSNSQLHGSDEVADVTGAGDTVIATFTLALAAGAGYREAAQLANYAGGIVVMKRGTATVSQKELLEALEKAPPATRAH